LIQFNRGETRHTLARYVFHGQRRELRQRSREGQEDQLGALGMIVLWDAIYIQDALDELRAQGEVVRPEDVERLSPLVFHHINLQSKYHFILPEEIAQGQHRPLRDPQTVQFTLLDPLKGAMQSVVHGSAQETKFHAMGFQKLAERFDFMLTVMEFIKEDDCAWANGFP